MQNQEKLKAQNIFSLLQEEKNPFENIYEYICRICGILYLKDTNWQADEVCVKCYEKLELE